MNQDNIPVKYSMGVWKQLGTYPTKLDILYEVYHFLFKLDKKEFSEQTLNAVWVDGTGAQNWKGTVIEKIVNDLMRDGTFKTSREEASGKVWYVIADNLNPFL